MAEVKNYTFNYKEIAEALIKRLDLHEGLWGVYLEFGIAGANVNPGPGMDLLLPAAVVPVLKIGIQRFEQANPLTVDAASVNPVAPARSATGRRKRTA
jgi:hypothetical protein